MTVAYADAGLLAEALTPGVLGDRISGVWRSMDSVCAHEFVTVEVPSLIGQAVDRVAWIWLLDSMALIETTDPVAVDGRRCAG